MLEKNEKKPIPTWDEIYASRQPSELEQSIAAQHAPGYIPPGWQQWILDSLPATDPRKIEVLRAQINGVQLSEEALNELFKQ
jgi:hypothetical protein